jgi:hypothetical protein
MGIEPARGARTVIVVRGPAGVLTLFALGSRLFALHLPQPFDWIDARGASHGNPRGDHRRRTCDGDG